VLWWRTWRRLARLNESHAFNARCWIDAVLRRHALKSLGTIAALALGLAIPAHAAARDTVTIGFTVSQTGALKVDFVAQRNGLQLWRDDVNKIGGIKLGDKQYKIKFVSYDDQSKP
jgi:ABC-type branched-subunit amino acid transport system substrate-binding protein